MADVVSLTACASQELERRKVSQWFRSSHENEQDTCPLTKQHVREKRAILENSLCRKTELSVDRQPGFSWDEKVIGTPRDQVIGVLLKMD